MWYCEAIGIHYTTADNWLARWFPEEYGGVENAMAWLYISTPFWTVGIEIDHMLVVVTTPPICKWMIGRAFDKVIAKIQNEYNDVVIRELS